VGLISGLTSGLTSFALPFAASPLVAGVSSVASTGFGSSKRGNKFGNWNMNSLFSGPSYSCQLVFSKRIRSGLTSLST
jgi:hypothetical protein